MDEPFYACYLLESGAEHPGRDAIIESMEGDFNAILDEIQWPFG